MRRQVLPLAKWKWLCLVYYDAGRNTDVMEILSELDGLGASSRDKARVWRCLGKGTLNTGFTYSNPDLRQSIMVIGRTDSAGEFQDTYDHEKGHLAMHIAETDGIDPYGETYQYLAGDIGKMTYPLAREFLCDCGG